MVKNLPANAGDIRDVFYVPGSGRSPEERNGNPLQYSCLGNPMDRGAWKATVHGVAKSQTQLDPIDCSPPGSSVQGISQARMLEWVAISFSKDLPDPGIKQCLLNSIQILFFFSKYLFI